MSVLHMIFVHPGFNKDDNIHNSEALTMINRIFHSGIKSIESTHRAKKYMIVDVSELFFYGGGGGGG